MSATATPTAILHAEIEEVLRTIPPLATRRHDTPENHAWMGRAANAIAQWDPGKRSAFDEFNRQFHGRNAHEANDAFQSARDEEILARALAS